MKYDPIPGRETVFYQIVRWDENDDTPNPLRGCINPTTQNVKDCEVHIAYSGGGTGWALMFAVSFREMNDVRTIGELARLFREKGLLNEKSRFTPLNSTTQRICYQLGYRKSSFSYIMPGGALNCNGVEILPTYCSISELYIELDHGAISADSVNGHTVSKPLRASCNTNFKVRIGAEDGDGVLPLGSGLQSRLKINGADLGAGYIDTVGPGGKSFTLSSTLSGYTGGTGTFQGSKVIMLSLP